MISRIISGLKVRRLYAGNISGFKVSKALC
ncbi:hypothetical protein F383_08480 [Gossypium arboreum]|uniref:Uncharacterized protein n=1 Tax=Gossypium arboreum TaxID=29729 RepID=A0A0B0PSW0_GOSAR|nr:hypothetical protein F383_08480 [Gossypium arboreum]